MLGTIHGSQYYCFIGKPTCSMYINSQVNKQESEEPEYLIVACFLFTMFLLCSTKASSTISYFSRKMPRRANTITTAGLDSPNRRQEIKLNLFNPETVQRFGVCSTSTFDSEAFVYMAVHYRFPWPRELDDAKRVSLEEAANVCEHNAMIAEESGQSTITQTWQILNLLCQSFLSEDTHIPTHWDCLPILRQALLWFAGQVLRSEG